MAMCVYAALQIDSVQLLKAPVPLTFPPHPPLSLPTQPPPDFAPGTLLGGGQYEVAELLGRGGNGVTYRCRDTQGGGDVAVKVLSLRRLVGRRLSVVQELGAG